MFYWKDFRSFSATYRPCRNLACIENTFSTALACAWSAMTPRWLANQLQGVLCDPQVWYLQLFWTTVTAPLSRLTRAHARHALTDAWLKSVFWFVGGCLVWLLAALGLDSCVHMPMSVMSMQTTPEAGYYLSMQRSAGNCRLK